METKDVKMSELTALLFSLYSFGLTSAAVV